MMEMRYNKRKDDTIQVKKKKREERREMKE